MEMFIEKESACEAVKKLVRVSSELPNPLGDPPALPGRQPKFYISGNRCRAASAQTDAARTPHDPLGRREPRRRKDVAVHEEQVGQLAGAATSFPEATGLQVRPSPFQGLTL